MTERDRLIAMIHELRQLALEAKQRGDASDPDELPADYWYGVQFGLEEAAQRLEDMLREDADPAAGDPE